MLEALFDQIKGVIGKTYVVAGLIPAAVIVLGWRWFQQGKDEPRRWVALLLNKPEDASIEAVSLLVVVAGLGLFFFTARRLLLHLFQSLPGRLLAPMRKVLLGRQRKLWHQANQDRQISLWNYTLLRWPSRSFEKPKYVPSFIEPKDLKATIEASKKARVVVAGLASPGGSVTRVSTAEEIDTITAGLGLLYSHYREAANSQDCEAEIKEWAALTSQSRARSVFEEAGDEVSRRLLDARRRSRMFPGNERWIQPTALGNLVAALDDYAESRYNIDTATLWTRLWGTLSPEERSEVSDSQLSVETFTNLSVALACLALAMAVAAIREGHHQVLVGASPYDGRMLRFVLVTPALAWVSYRSAVYAFGALSEKVIRLVDLKRLAVIRALGFKSPATVGEEKELFRGLRGFFTQGTPLDEKRELEKAG